MVSRYLWRFVILGVCVFGWTAVSNPAAAQTPNWLRAYLGAQGGYAWEDLDLSGPPPAPFSSLDDFEGGLVGIQGGANFFQDGLFIGGIVADFMWLNVSDRVSATQSATRPKPGGCVEEIEFEGEFDCGNITRTSTNSLKAEVDWKASVRAKAGYLLNPSTLFYLTGGIAFADIEVTATSKTTVVAVPPPPPPISVTRTSSDSTILTGVVYGAGLEGFLTPDISTFVQVLHYDFASEDLHLADARVGVDLEETVIEAGISFYFN